MEDFLELLRERALHIKLKVPNQGGAVDVLSVIKMLEALNASYGSYIEAEARSAVTGKHTATVEKEIKILKADAKLLFVDLSFASFEAAVTPNSVTAPHKFLNIQDTADFKKKTFKSYQEEVIFSDPNNSELLKKLEDRFDADERRAIFSPLYKTVFRKDGFEFYAGRANKPLKKIAKNPTDDTVKRLMPAVVADKAEQVPHTVAIYATAVGDANLFGERKLKVLKHLAVEELEHDTYPHQFQTIGFGGTTYELVKPYSAVVRFDEDTYMYHVDFEALNIHTWGETRLEAVEAFEFSFVDMVEEYHDAADRELTSQAKQVKKTLREMINVRLEK